MSYAIKHGYVNLCILARDFGHCLETAGYSVICVDDDPTNKTIPDASAFLPSGGEEGEPVKTTLSFVVENTATVDPCAATQKWRMKVKAEAGKDIQIWQATDLQISNSGATTPFPGGRDDMDMCELTLGGEPARDESGSFFSYTTMVGDSTNPKAAPLSMICTIAKHGLSFCIWVEGMDNAGGSFTWFTTQRGIQKDGTPWTQKKAPLWTVFSVGGGGVKDVDSPTLAAQPGICQFVVSETDVRAPTRPQPADRDWADSTRLFNVHQQVSITEDEKFNLSVPRDLVTQRYFYPLELDLIGYSSADVIAQYAEAPVRMYGEEADRVYKALNSNAKNNKGMRILFLVKHDSNLIDISKALA